MFKYCKRLVLEDRRLAIYKQFSHKASVKYDINKDPEYHQFHQKSTIELTNELETCLAEFDDTHKDMSLVIDRFPKVLDQWGWRLLKSPFLDPKHDFVHLSKPKSNTSSTAIDVLLDYRVPDNEGLREMQLLLTREDKGSLYFIGALDKAIGFTSGSCLAVPASDRSNIVQGNQDTFNKLGAQFSKYMESDETELNELNWMVQDAIETNTMKELEGIREKFDVFLYDLMAKETGLIAYGEAEVDSKLLRIIWLIAVYSELAARRNWLLQLKRVLT